MRELPEEYLSYLLFMVNSASIQPYHQTFLLDAIAFINTGRAFKLFLFHSVLDYFECCTVAMIVWQIANKCVRRPSIQG